MKYETVLNMTTAKALGLDVPTSILLSADERNTATQEDWIADGGNGSNSAVSGFLRHGCFTPETGDCSAWLAGQKSARSGCEQPQQTAPLFSPILSTARRKPAPLVRGRALSKR